MKPGVNPNDLVLEVTNLHKAYGATEALRGVSFKVPRGAFYGFFGRNGAGKSTTLDIVTGLLGRDQGLVRLLGEEVGVEPSPAVKQRFAYVGGHIQLYGWMTLQQHLDYVAGFYDHWDQQRCEELQGVFRLPMKKLTGTLSPGQHLQFQLLMALARHPELLLMDEPGNLDVVVRANLMEALIGILEAGESTVLMASHLISELEGVCDYLCVIDQGVSVASGAVEELVAGVRELHIKGPHLTETPALAGVWHRRLSDHEIRVLMAGYSEQRAKELVAQLSAESYEVGPVSLEEFFISLTTDKD